MEAVTVICFDMQSVSGRWQGDHTPPNEPPLCPAIFSYVGQLEWVATRESSTNRTYQDSLLFAGLNVLAP